MRKNLALLVIVAFAVWVGAPILIGMTPEEFFNALKFAAIFLALMWAFAELVTPPRKPRKAKQPVPGVYGPDQHAAGFVAKEVG